MKFFLISIEISLPRQIFLCVDKKFYAGHAIFDARHMIFYPYKGNPLKKQANLIFFIGQLIQEQAVLARYRKSMSELR